MEFFRIKRDIPFMSWGKYTTTISLLTFIVAVFFLVTKGLNLGVDFTGGTVMEVAYSHPADIDQDTGHAGQNGDARRQRAEFRHIARRIDTPAGQAGDVQRQAVRNGDSGIASG